MNVRSQKTTRRNIDPRRYKNYSNETLEYAIHLVTSKKMSTYDVEKLLNIPRKTIDNRIKGLHTSRHGSPNKLTDAEEKKILDVIKKCEEFGSSMTQLDIRLIVFDYLKTKNRSHIFNEKLPGPWWAKHFMSRYNLDPNKTRKNNTDIKAEKICNEIVDYFMNLEKSLKDVPPRNILNYDEINLTDNTNRCICRRSFKYPERFSNTLNTRVSIMFSVSADGKCLPTYSVYKSDNILTTPCKTGLNGSRYNTTESGWLNAETFMDWFKHIIIPWAKTLKGPKVIIGDNLSCHFNVEIYEYCNTNNIRFVFLPSKSIRLTQPLNISFFSLLKKEWQKIVLSYNEAMQNEVILNKCHISRLLKKVIENIKILEKDHILKGFCNTGISPFNPHKVLTKIPDYKDARSGLDLLKYFRENTNPDSDSDSFSINSSPRLSHTKNNVSINSSDMSSSDVFTILTEDSIFLDDKSGYFHIELY